MLQTLNMQTHPLLLRKQIVLQACIYFQQLVDAE